VNNAEERLKTRAISNGPEAFNINRVRLANELTHMEPFRDYVLLVRGGIGSFSIGTIVDLMRDGKSLISSYATASWVWEGKEEALRTARISAHSMAAVLETGTASGHLGFSLEEHVNSMRTRKVVPFVEGGILHE
jgi:hypothetical protein